MDNYADSISSIERHPDFLYVFKCYDQSAAGYHYVIRYHNATGYPYSSMQKSMQKSIQKSVQKSMQKTIQKSMQKSMQKSIQKLCQNH